jgi:hypothetical protein
MRTQIFRRRYAPQGVSGLLSRSVAGAAQYRQTRIFGEARISEGALAEVIGRFVLSRHGPAI